MCLPGSEDFTSMELKASAVQEWLEQDGTTKRDLAPTKSLPSTIFMKGRIPSHLPGPELNSESDSDDNLKLRLEKMIFAPRVLRKTGSVPTYLEQLSYDADESDFVDDNPDEEHHGLMMKPLSSLSSSSKTNRVEKAAGNHPGSGEGALYSVVDYPIPTTRKRSKKMSTTSSVHSTGSSWSLDNPFINLMSEARIRKISADRISNFSTIEANQFQFRKVSESPSQKSVPEEIEMIAILDSHSDPQGSSTRRSQQYPNIMSSRARSKNRLHTRMSGNRQGIIRNQQAKTAQGSWVFENYQQQIYERTHKPWKQSHQDQNSNDQGSAIPTKKVPIQTTRLRSVDENLFLPNKPFNRRRSSAQVGSKARSRNPSRSPESSDRAHSQPRPFGSGPSGDEELTHFRRHTRTRSTWAPGNKPGAIADSNEPSMTRDDEQGNIGKRTTIKKSFQRIGKIFGQRK
ncbi:hypothetical protein TCAL_05461 [Tigriopus californicus]|uniref:Uncharacterized protein n=1 Tax=Tigriopus californicus TaxID=6832 RepID=A0A553P5U1_TIGCA|nr:uncharacterized protein LOC131878585 [Tigriopus californicus]TRY73057.1 hypothetical protein TCAL_05461 [Tigriopus californicus]|eukprot:TCALIF_05461-PA protein Name:"Protein of unknown function" AED:0.00 eAED:0.00 QI:132/1/1/1/1/1/2/17/456